MGACNSLGDRMKQYESAASIHLTRRTPVIVRVDGRAFHTLCRGADKPYDARVIDAMNYAASRVAKAMDGCRLVYVQSDEASFLLCDYARLETEPWFGYDLQKVVSVAASEFTRAFDANWTDKPATFDARAFNLPESEVSNYFLWRAKDWHRNSVHMFARSVFSHRELHGKSIAEVHEMLHSAGKNWATDTTPQERNGTFHTIEAMHVNVLPRFDEVDTIVQHATRFEVNDKGGES